MKGEKKRVVSFLLVICMLAAIMGCGKKEGMIGNPLENPETVPVSEGEKPDSDEEVEQSNAETTNIQYVTKSYTFDETEFVTAECCNQNFCFFVTEYYDNYNAIYKLQKLDLLTGEITVLQDKIVLENYLQISAMQMDAEGNLQMLCNKMENGVLYLGILKYSQEGNQISQLELPSINDNPEMAAQYINLLCVDMNGNYYIRSNDAELSVFNEEGVNTATISSGGMIYDMCSTAENEILVVYQNPVEMGNMIGIVDLEQKKITALSSGVQEMKAVWRIDYGTESGILINTDSALLSYNLETDKAKSLVEWLDCGIEYQYVQQIYEIKPQEFAVFQAVYQDNTFSQQLTTLRKSDTVKPEKTTLLLGCMKSDSYIRQAVVAFNKENEEYEVKVKEYQSGNLSRDEAIALLNADIVAGTGPDLLSLKNMSQYAVNFMEKGVLLDLYPYMEQDPTMNKEDFLKNILDLYSLDGSLYGIMTTYLIETLVGRKSMVGDSSTWSAFDVAEVMKQHPECEKIINFESKEQLLSLFLAYDADSFIDYDKAECYFDTELFRTVLEIANSSDTWEIDFNKINFYVKEPFEKGELMLLTPYLESALDIQSLSKRYGEDLIFMSYPSEQGRRTSASELGPIFAICSASENIDAAWSFISGTLSVETQAASENCFPVRISALEQMIEEAMTPEYYYDEDGNSFEVSKKSFSYEGEGELYQIFAATQDEMDLLWELLYSINTKFTYNDYFSPIIYEEANEYFSGKQSLEDTCKVIQNRVHLYLSENDSF